MPRDASFRAMGVDVEVRGATDAQLVSVRALFEEWEQVFSRFRAESELSAVNRSGRAVEVSPLFRDVLRHALAAAAATGGLVDPTLGAAVEAAGYDRDFDALRPDVRPPGPPAPGRWREVRLAGNVLLRPEGVQLDLNGVAKALAVDEALRLLDGPGFVAAGGDLAVRAGAVASLPGGGAVRIHSGGLATSGTTGRRWLRDGELQHHLIDPATGRPSSSRWLHVTVGAGSCLAADVAAKAAFLLDDDGPDWLEERCLPGRFLTADAVVIETSRWPGEAVAA